MQITEDLETSTAIVKHDGETLEFFYAFYASSPKLASGEEEDKLKYVNQYLNFLPKAEQDQIFKHYKNARDILANTDYVDELIRGLAPCFQGIYESLDYERMEEFIKTTDIKVHIDIRDSFKEQPGEILVGTKERTYVAKDYLGLIGFCIASRIVLPIWADFLDKIGTDVNKVTRSTWALLLIEPTNLTDTPIYNKLKEHICNAIPSDVNLSSSIVSGNSREAFERWIVSVIVVTVLTKTWLCGRSKTPNGNKLASIVSVVYHTAFQKAKGSPKNFGTPIQPKKPETDPTTNDEACFTEVFKSAQKLSTLDIEELKLFLEDPVIILRDLDNSIDPDSLTPFLEAGQRISTEEIKPPQKIMAQWILGCKQIQPPESIDHMGHKNLRETILPVVQCYLWHHGFYDLSILTDCYAIPASETSAGGNRKPKAHVDQLLSEELNTLYPYIRKDKNEALISMAFFEEELRKHRWRRSLATDLVTSVGGSESEHYLVPSTLRNQLANLFIHLNK